MSEEEDNDQDQTVPTESNEQPHIQTPETQITYDRDACVALADQLTTAFLKDKRYKDLGKPFKEVVADFKLFAVDELLMQRPDLVESGDLVAIQETAQRSYSAACRGRLTGAASRVKLRVLAVSWPLNYIGLWTKKRHDAFINACRQRDAGNPHPLNILMGIEPDDKGNIVAWVDANGVPLEHREKGDAKGKPFKVAHSFMANVVVQFDELIGKKRKMFTTLTIGGEGGDDIVNTSCRKCGFISYKRFCPNMIETRDARNNTIKIPCNTEKPFYEFESIVSAAFTEVETNLKITINQTTNAEDIRWDASTSVLGDKRQLTKDELKDMIGGVLKPKIVTGAQLVKFWEDNKDIKGVWVAYVGTVSQVNRTPKGGQYRVDLDDQSLAFTSSGKAVGGVPVFIPIYVWDCMDGNQITAYSQLLVIGDVRRREKSQKGADGRWINLQGQWREPEIRAWGFAVIDGGAERKIKHDVAEGSFSISAQKALGSDSFGALGSMPIMPTTVVEQVAIKQPAYQPPVQQPSVQQPVQSIQQPVVQQNEFNDETDNSQPTQQEKPAPQVQSASKPEDDWV